MRFMVTFAWKPDPKTRNEGIARFKATGGLPPSGAKLVQRWTRADFSGGFVLLDSDDAKALAAFAHSWGDLMELSIVPVVDDEELTEVLRRVGTQAVDQTKQLTMLVFTRKKNEALNIGDDIFIVVSEIRGDKVRLAIEIPKEMTLHRGEVYEALNGMKPDSALLQDRQEDANQRQKLALRQKIADLETRQQEIAHRLQQLRLRLSELEGTLTR